MKNINCNCKESVDTKLLKKKKTTRKNNKRKLAKKKKYKKKCTKKNIYKQKQRAWASIFNWMPLLERGYGELFDR